jgi:hypothetical protein
MRPVRHAILSTACVLGAAACVQTRPAQTITRSVELDQARAVDVEVRLGAGELTVGGGSPKLLDATFRTNLASEPVVDYQPGEDRATLRIQQPSGGASFGRTENNWDLRFNDEVPIDLTARVGAAEATLDLGTLNLERLDVEMGAGELNLDLRGTPRQSYAVRVSGGVGAAHIRVPSSVGIEATGAAGIGSIDMQGLTKRGDTWYNPGHEDDPVKIRFDVKGGVGEISVSAEP